MGAATMTNEQIIAPNDAPQLALRDLAGRLAREMRIGAAIADDCQEALGAVVFETLDYETAARVQGLDLLSQQLIEIGRMLERVVDTPITGMVAASLLDDICLSDLKRRLAGGRIDVLPSEDVDVW